MVKKALLCSVLLFIAYSIFVQWLSPQWWSSIQNTQQENIVKAQNYLYNKRKTASTVIVGSSLSARIVADSMRDTYNLALGGQSAYDGLKIITHKSVLPKLVLIEMNLVFRREDKNFTSSLFSPLMYYPKKELKSLREEEEPIAILGKISLNAIYNFKDYIRGGNAKKKTEATPLYIKPDSSAVGLSNKMIKDAYLAFFKLPGHDDVAYCFNSLKTYTDELQKKGVKVVFFEMPIDNRLENLPFSNFIREQFYAHFPKTAYIYIERPHWGYCDTFDGQHLNGQQAIVYTAYLNEQLKKLGL